MPKKSANVPPSATIGISPVSEHSRRQEQVAERPPGVEPAEQRRGVGETLAESQARHDERVLDPEDLHGAGTPAVAAGAGTVAASSAASPRARTSLW